MEILTYALVYAAGIITGIGLFIAYAAYQMKKLRGARNELLDKIQKTTKDMESRANSIKERLLKASNLTKAQVELRAQAEAPSKNALHSKHQNGLLAEINHLEQQKIDILRTVLAEGFDPMVRIKHDDGVEEEILLSQYVNTSQSVLGESAPPPLPNVEPKKIGKFFIFKGGKDDGTTH